MNFLNLAYQLGELATIMYKCTSVVINEEMAKSYKIIVEHLEKGYPILVPYDSDRNHEPCKAKGYYAHWAVLTGTYYLYDNILNSVV